MIMKIRDEVLEKIFALFKDFVSRKDGRLFTDFSMSKYLDQEENYKYQVYEEAKSLLGGKTSNYQWTVEDIGSGRIQKSVNRAIKITGNNLVFRGNSRSYLPSRPDEELERILFDFYKNNITPQVAFNQLQNKGILYQLIAYLFFIKDKDQYLPISQERFDAIFTAIGLVDFKTTRNASWENYSTYIGVIKGVREFLKKKGTQPTLLDAHSFLWIFGNQYQKEKQNNKINFTSLNRSEESEISIEDELAEERDALLQVAEEDDEMYFPEGREVYLTHKTKERNRALIKTVKTLALKKYGELRCQICDFSFKDIYGELGDGFLEAHHLVPISIQTSEVEARPSDIVLVCSNCHRMLHRYRPWISRIDELKMIMMQVRHGTMCPHSEKA